MDTFDISNKQKQKISWINPLIKKTLLMSKQRRFNVVRGLGT